MLSFKRMTDIEECFAGNGDDGSLIECELLSRARVKRESRARPTKNRIGISHHCGWAATSTMTIPRFIAGRVLHFNI